MGLCVGRGGWGAGFAPGMEHGWCPEAQVPFPAGLPRSPEHPTMSEDTHSSTAVSMHHHGCTLKSALEMIVNLYHRYSAREGKDDFLSLKDLNEFLKCQAPTFLAACVSGTGQAAGAGQQGWVQGCNDWVHGL